MRFAARSLIGAAVTLSSLLIVADASAQVNFTAARRLPTGLYPWATATADFNRDGLPDVAVTDHEADNVMIFLGDGLGRFSTRGTYPTGEAPGSVIAADFDEDGILDLAAATGGFFAGSLTVLTGDGTGGFGAPLVMPTDDSTSNLVAADFDEDGHLDVAVSNEGLFTISLFFGDGSGQFTTAQSLAPGPGPTRLVSADVDEDGHLDLVALCVDYPEEFIAIHFGDGAGGFSLIPQRVDWSRGPFECGEDLTLGDLDGDGHLDIAVVQSDVIANATTVSVLLGDGTGSFGPDRDFPSGMSSAVQRIVSGDWDADGRVDLAVSIYNGVVAVLLGTGTGRFRAPTFVPSDGYTRSIAAADLDLDGREDLVVTNNEEQFDTGNALILLGNGGGGFLAASKAPLAAEPLFSGAQAIALADLNADGHQDAIVPHYFRTTYSVLLGDGTGALTALPVFSTGQSPRFAAIADFDEDGLRDVAFSLSSPNQLAVHLGNGSGSFESPQLFDVGGGPWALLAEDLDGDGHVDLVCSNGLSSSVSVLRGHGALGFDSEQRFAVGTRPLSLVAADLDGDGIKDLATANVDGPSLSVLRGNGTGGFLPGPTLATGRFPMALAAGDVDEDGRADLAVVSVGDENVSILLADGLGGFTLAGAYGVRGDVRELKLVDLDEDDHLDLLAGSFAPDDIFVWSGDGTGSFGSRVGFSIDDKPSQVGIADLDEDGHPDLATVAYLSNQVRVALNRSHELTDCRRGNVNRRAGAVTDVLFVNGSPGEGPERRVVVGPGQPFELRIDAPPSNPTGPALNIVCAWIGEPTRPSVRWQPFGLGLIGMPTPLQRAAGPQPRLMANTMGHPAILGPERWPGPHTAAAPTVLLSFPNGHPRPGTYYLQGIIRDPQAPNGVAATTNGIVKVVQ